MIQQKAKALTFYGMFTESKVGKTGLTVTVDVYEGTTATPIVSAGNATELAGGLYYYTLSSGSNDANGMYITVFKTATTTVDLRHVPAAYMIPTWADEVSSILEDTGTTIPGTITTIDGIVDSILEDTGTTLPATLSTIDGIVDSILEDTGTTLPGTLSTIAGYLDTEIAAILADTNELQTDLTNGGRLDLLIDAIKAKTDNIPAAPATEAKQDTIIGYLDTEIAAILEDTSTTIPAQIAGLNNLSSAQVQTAAAAALTAYDPPTKAELDSAVSPLATAADLAVVDGNVDSILADTNELQTNQGNWLTATGFSTHDPADVVTAMQDVAGDFKADVSGLATAADLATVDGIVDDIKAVTVKLDTALESDGAVYRFTENALEEAPTGGSAPSAADIADAVWDEAIGGHLGAGSTGAALNAAGSAGDPWTTELPGSYTGTQAGKVIADVKAKTDGLNFTGTDVKATLDGEEVDVGKVKAVPLTSVNDFKADTSNLALEATAQSIKDKTDNLPASPAASGEYTSALATIQADLDNPSQYKADVSALATSAELAALEAHGDDNWGAGAVPSAADIADAVWDELIAAHATAGTTGAALLAAGAAGDPNTGLPSSYTTGQIGYLIGEMAARLNTSNAVVLSALQSDPLNIRRGDTLPLRLTGLGTMTGYSEVWFTVKSAISHSDTEAVLQITTAGLQRINGAIGTAGNATLTVTDATNGDVTITCAASEMAKLAIRNGLYYDLQVKIGTTVSTLAFGRLNVVEDVTKATS